MKRTLLALAAVCISASAQATVVFDGGNPDQSGAYFADRDFAYFEAATRFTLGSAITANEIEWWGPYLGGTGNASDDDFILRFYADGGATPGTLLHTYNIGTGNRVATGVFLFGVAEFAYSAAYSDLTLAAGTYFLSLSNDNNSTTGIWAWETTGGGPQSGGTSHNSTGWTSDPDENLAFKLHYDQVSQVPEPATLALLGLGLAGLGFSRRQGVGRVSAA